MPARLPAYARLPKLGQGAPARETTRVGQGASARENGNPVSNFLA
ncbi:MAG: hypothetical protein Q7J98_11355 [Kiritimatiellia bacterium]|nr:hypothetical protein [Kiritimatiellia bacterium]